MRYTMNYEEGYTFLFNTINFAILDLEHMKDVNDIIEYLKKSQKEGTEIIDNCY